MKISESNRMRYKKLRHGMLISIFITFMLCMPSLTLNVMAADIIVDDDGSGDHTTISAAILAASHGDTIWVREGSYNEQLLVDKSVTIIADVVGSRPIIYATTYSPGIDVTAGEVRIEGFKIYGNSNPGGGPSIRASAGADGLIVRDNQFLVIPGEMGNAALQINTGVQDVTYTANSLVAYDIGVLLQPGSSATIPNNNVYQTYNYTISHAASILGLDRYYGSIQDAVDIAETDDTVEVMAGSYNENVVISDSITLNGVQAGENPVIGRFGDESTIDGNFLSSVRIASGVTNVTVDGFTLTISSKDPFSNQAGVLIGSNTDNIDVINNIIENITDGSFGPGSDTLADETYGIMVYGHAGSDNQTNITVANNLIQNVEEYGIAINDNTSHVIISNNYITEMIGSDHTGNGPPWDPAWPAIICSAIHLGGQVGPINDIAIVGNILKTNVTGDGSSSAAGGGISFAGIQEPLPPNRNWQGFEQISIVNNIISNNSMGIVALAGMSNGSIEVFDNNISGNSLFGINNIVVDASFNAISNWWGNITGPFNATDNPTGTGDNVFGNVTFSPWYEYDGYSVIPDVTYEVGYPKSNDDGDIISDITEISISASDAQSGLKSLTYRVWDTINRWSEWQNYTEKIKLTGEGKHKVQYNATDNAGTTAGLNSWEIETHYVDTISPEVEVLYPNGDEFISGLLLIEWVAADKILDQGQIEENGSVSLSGDYPGHIQSFVPTEDTIGSVQLLLDGDDANVSVKIFSQISPVPNLIAQSTQRLQAVGHPDAPVWIDFPFDADIDLDGDETYYIGVTQEVYGNTGFNWYYLNSSGGDDPYEYGHAWVKETDSLVNMSEWDWGFRTMLWETDVDITVEYSMTGVSPWSTIDEYTVNNGYYTWDTTPFPDGDSYRIRIVARDEINNLGADFSDNTFSIDNDGPSISDIIITDTTIESTEYTKNGDNLEITATIAGNPINISADLSGFGKGTEVTPNSYTGGTARWILSSIICSTSDGPISVSISANDSTGDSSFNVGSIIADNTVPNLDITRPGPGLYFMDSMRLLPFAYPFIIGQITLIAEADDGEGSGIEKVEFYLENRLEANVSEEPYSWLWDRAATGFFDIEVIAYDNVGHVVNDEVRDLFIINLDIWSQNP